MDAFFVAFSHYLNFTFINSFLQICINFGVVFEGITNLFVGYFFD